MEPTLNPTDLNRIKHQQSKKYHQALKDKKESHQDRQINFAVRILGKTDFRRKQAYKHMNKYKSQNNNKEDHPKGQYQVRKKVKDLLEFSDSFLEMNTKWSDADMSGKRDNWEIYLNEFQKVKQKWEIIPTQYTAEELEMTVLSGELPTPCKVADLGCGQIEIATQLAKVSDIKIDNYDLHAYDKSVIVEDLDYLGSIKDNSYHVSILCLSLLGKIKRKINQAYRITKNKGWIYIWHPKSQREKLKNIIQELEELEMWKDIKLYDMDRFVHYKLQVNK